MKRALRIILKTLLAIGVILIVMALAIAAIAFSYRKTACVMLEHQNFASSTPPHAEELAHIPGYIRPVKTTYLTFPEWYIVYSAREYGSYLSNGGTPSDFPYRESIGRFWCSYRAMAHEAAASSQVSTMDTVMLYVIGSSYSAEYLVKDVYENTFGRVSELIGGVNTPEDIFYGKFTKDYAQFLNETPWYDYPFFSKFRELWKQPTKCPVNIRSCERRVLYSVELLLKAAYGKAIGHATHATYVPADLSTMLLVKNVPPALTQESGVSIVKQFDDGTEVVSLPRYQEFTDLLEKFSATDMRILDLAGNQTILVSISSHKLSYTLPGDVVMEMGEVSGDTRLLVVVTAQDLLKVVNATKDTPPLDADGHMLEHIYDY